MTTKTTTSPPESSTILRVGIVVPHIFMQQAILPQVIFSPGALAIELADGLQARGVEVALLTPGAVTTSARNSTADLSYFESELAGRGYGYIELLKKHPLTFISLARQVQSELLATAFAMANNDELDIVHVYTNEEDIALPFAQLCRKPVVFTHHDPFNFSVKYKNVFPKYAHLNWLSISLSQRQGMPTNTNWLANIYHGLDARAYQPSQPQVFAPYVAYLGRIIEPKGVHLAIEAVKAHNNIAANKTKYTLKIAGKHYAGASKDSYWQERIEPQLDDIEAQYVGFIKTPAEKQAFLGGASALIIPSTFEEPFGMVMIEALACGTPLIGLNSGAIPEVITPQTGFVVGKEDAVPGLIDALERIRTIDRAACRADFEARFTLDHMIDGHLAAYQKLLSP
jgi:glycosyltransferase involved in cell wall biosynthesis